MIRFFKTLFRKDELVGRWDTDDKSGLYSLVFGTYIEINSGGTGLHEFWYNSDDERENYHKKYDFNWERIGVNEIKVTFSDGEVKRYFYEIFRNNGRIELNGFLNQEFLFKVQ